MPDEPLVYMDPDLQFRIAAQQGVFLRHLAEVDRDLAAAQRILEVQEPLLFEVMPENAKFVEGMTSDILRIRDYLAVVEKIVSLDASSTEISAALARGANDRTQEAVDESVSQIVGKRS